MGRYTITTFFGHTGNTITEWKINERI
jgi:hypothetical protein